MLEFILVLSALTMFVSFIAVIRPIKSLRLPTRKRALGVLLLSCLISEEAWKDYEGQCIEWKGTLEHLDSGLFGGIRIGMKHKQNTITYDASISAPEHEKDLLLTWREGKRTHTEAGWKITGTSWGSVSNGGVIEASVAG